ncbi:MAG: DUF4147 domain-containing protein, partial [Anaerolineales bacterium]|nr:DUF4147 domain-containing protein [Anaerolineales bacterium]MDW8445780.1 DUF4147 domain-containing protein [Anaerolineales bacterium]
MPVEFLPPLPYSLQSHPWRTVVLDALCAALNAVNGEQAVCQNLHLEGDQLWVGEQRFPLEPRGRLAVLAVGKAAVAMARGAKAVLGERVSQGLIVTKFLPQDELAPFPVMLGDHPIPKQRSLRAAQAVGRFLKSLQPGDTLLCLISGGASALLTLPRSPLRLRDLQKTTQLLLRCGATIYELNTLRKHLERLKGGGIVKSVNSVRVISLIISDVIGDAVEVIGSGMTTADPTTFGDAIEVIDRYELRRLIPPSVLEYLLQGAQGLYPETLKPNEVAPDRVLNHVIASNRHACEAAQRSLQSSGVEVFYLTSYLQGEASQVGRVFAAFARHLCATRSASAPPLCWIAGGETTVTVRGNGIGG